MTYEYLSSCCDGEITSYLEDAIDMAKEISYSQFIGYVSEDVLKSQFSNYNFTDDDSNGLRIQDDYAVTFYKSVYQGIPCVFLRESGIEYIYVPEDFFENDIDSDDENSNGPSI